VLLWQISDSAEKSLRWVESFLSSGIWVHSNSKHTKLSIGRLVSCRLPKRNGGLLKLPDMWSPVEAGIKQIHMAGLRSETRIFS
jgi:hypothetical protein